jgi:hypothetical protein
MANYLAEEDAEMRQKGYERVLVDGQWGYILIPWYRRVWDKIVEAFN